MKVMLNFHWAELVWRSCLMLRDGLTTFVKDGEENNDAGDTGGGGSSLVDEWLEMTSFPSSCVEAGTPSSRTMSLMEDERGSRVTSPDGWLWVKRAV